MNNLTSQLDPKQQEVWAQSLALAKACDFEEGHSFQVTHLALRLFDELTALHQLSAQERYYLLLAGLLHDIGWIEGWKGHHKSSLNFILTAPMLPFDNRERLLIGSVCRYHRRALPDLKHDHYAALDEADRLVVTRLAALLRVADGLDYTHRSLVNDVKVLVGSKRIRIACICSAPAPDEISQGLKKGNLMEKVFFRELIIEWKGV